MRKNGWILLLFLFSCSSAKQIGKRDDQSNDATYAGYLFAYFTGNDKSEEQIRFALSTDGYRYHALNNNNPVLSSVTISETGGVRDPHILRGADGKTFYMVATDMVSANGWSSNRGMVLMKSTDLINWATTPINIQKKFNNQEDLRRVWAPQTIYDDSAKKYMIYFSMKHGDGPDKIYFSYANDDFTDLATIPRQLFFSPDSAAAIDGDIVKKDGKYFLFFKTEDKQPGIKIAVSDRLTGGYVMENSNYVQQTSLPVEGAGTFKLNDGSGYILMYDMYASGSYQFTRTSDMKNFTVVDQEVSMNFHPRHGTVIPITYSEFSRLETKWGSLKDVLCHPANDAIRPINIVIDTVKHTLTLPVNPDTDMSAFDPMFKGLPGVKATPNGMQDFSAGPVNYVINKGSDVGPNYKVSVVVNHNPVLPGYFADPDIVYSNKTRRFYLYPTSDGFRSWSGTYFKTFSSSDLVHWKDEGVILDLTKDVSWASRNAWAPSIIEKKTGNDYKYFYYFCAAQKIGVAVSENPAGPFEDSGKPLIDQRPDGVKGGQQIDPAIFHDPVSNKDFIYWGNGYMAMAELSADMISLQPGTTKVITPDSTFREGAYVFYRNGTYYFLWSEDDTRSPNYRVRYGTAKSPWGPIAIPGDNLVIEKDPSKGIYGTGHNSVLQVPGTDDWYIIYHRFNYPNGITMGNAAGYNRETCIDKLEFNPDGSIRKVQPTHTGINAVSGEGK